MRKSFDCLRTWNKFQNAYYICRKSHPKIEGLFNLDEKSCNSTPPHLYNRAYILEIEIIMSRLLLVSFVIVPIGYVHVRAELNNFVFCIMTAGDSNLHGGHGFIYQIKKNPNDGRPSFFHPRRFAPTCIATEQSRHDNSASKTVAMVKWVISTL